jgi:hypothetical protein
MRSAGGYGAEPLYGLLAEFEEEDLVAAAGGLRAAGLTRWEACSPFPVHGLDEAAGSRPTRLPWLTLIGGLTGMALGLALCWWTNATSFPLASPLRGNPMLASGKPIFSLPANIPVIFETTILFGALATVFGMLWRNRLPRLYHPVFRHGRFRRATRDGFFLVIEAADPVFHRNRIAALLQDLGAIAVEDIPE